MWFHPRKVLWAVWTSHYLWHALETLLLSCWLYLEVWKRWIDLRVSSSGMVTLYCLKMWKKTKVGQWRFRRKVFEKNYKILFKKYSETPTVKKSYVIVFVVFILQNWQDLPQKFNWNWMNRINQTSIHWKLVKYQNMKFVKKTHFEENNTICQYLVNNPPSSPNLFYFE